MKAVRITAIHKDTGEEIHFTHVREAAKFAGVRQTTMSYRIRARSVDKNGYYYIAEDLTPEQLERKASRLKNPPPKEYKSDDMELDGRYHILKYEVRNLRVSITPCPYRRYPKPMVGSGECQKCTSFKGRNKQTHEVACKRQYI